MGRQRSAGRTARERLDDGAADPAGGGEAEHADAGPPEEAPARNRRIAGVHVQAP